MKVSSITALTLELKPCEEPTDDPWSLWLKYFEDWLKIIEVKLAVHEKSEKQNFFL